MRLPLLACALVACSSGRPDVDAPDALGAYSVGHGQIQVDSQSRALPVELWWPVSKGDEAGHDLTEYPLQGAIGLPSEVAYTDAPPASGPHPLLVFSHGYGGISTQSVSLMEALASHGFVVASPEHLGNSQSDGGDDFDTAASRRVPDVSAVIDGVVAQSEVPVDADRIGVLGHSFGGMTAVGVGAGWAGATADPRVDALMPISAVIDGDLQSDDRPSDNAGFTPEALASIAQPVLLLGGTEDQSVPIENNALAFDEMTGSPLVVRVDIIGANHTHFANICDIGDLLISLGFGPEVWPGMGAEALVEPYEATCSEDAFPIDEATRLQNLYAVSFFRSQLMGEADYDWFLTKKGTADEAYVELWRRGP